MGDINVSEIDKCGIRQAATTLHQSFKQDPLIRWIFIHDDHYAQKGLPVFETWVKYAVLYGRAFKTNHFESVALRKKPGDLKTSFWRIFRSGMLKTPTLLGKESFDRLMVLEELLLKEKRNNMGDRLFWYCWMLGTQPSHQKKGFGSALMNHTFEMAKKDHLPCYLETSSQASKQVHSNKGYQCLSEITLPQSDVKVYAMLRE